MTRVVDLTDRLAQLKGEPVEVTFAGRAWAIPARVPWALIRYHDNLIDRPGEERIAAQRRMGDALDAAIGALFGDEAVTFLRLGLPAPDCQAVLGWITSEVYGSGAESPGNSGGSSEPSGTGTDASEPTSGESTASTSTKNSGKKKSTG